MMCPECGEKPKCEQSDIKLSKKMKIPKYFLKRNKKPCGERRYKCKCGTIIYTQEYVMLSYPLKGEKDEKAKTK